jgi:hypothetical protein
MMLFNDIADEINKEFNEWQAPTWPSFFHWSNLFPLITHMIQHEMSKYFSFFLFWVLWKECDIFASQRETDWDPLTPIST